MKLYDLQLNHTSSSKFRELAVASGSIAWRLSASSETLSATNAAAVAAVDDAAAWAVDLRASLVEREAVSEQE